MKKTVIVIGGSDPSGGAGIQADLAVLCSLGLSALSVITAVTAQSEKKFLLYEPVSTKNFRAQLESILPLPRRAIVKIGMLGSSQLIPLLIRWLKKEKPAFVILDPVLQSSTERPLLDRKGLRILKQKLLSYADLVTPNVLEAEALSGLPVTDLETMENAAKRILKKVKKAVLLKGGHLTGPATDLLLMKKSPRGEQGGDFQIIRFTHSRILGKGAHGTGCTLASAIAGSLSLGMSLPEAVKKARRIVLRKIRQARTF
jgi:hydroxymethylpyrimidine/phosphomethylpyrimidine kinase